MRAVTFAFIIGVFLVGSAAGDTCKDGTLADYTGTTCSIGDVTFSFGALLGGSDAGALAVHPYTGTNGFLWCPPTAACAGFVLTGFGLVNNDVVQGGLLYTASVTNGAGFDELRLFDPGRMWWASDDPAQNYAGTDVYNYFCVAGLSQQAFDSGCLKAEYIFSRQYMGGQSDLQLGGIYNPIFYGELGWITTAHGDAGAQITSLDYNFKYDFPAPPPSPPGVPEPGSLMLVATGILGIVGTVRRRV